MLFLSFSLLFFFSFPIVQPRKSSTSIQVEEQTRRAQVIVLVGQKVIYFMRQLKLAFGKTVTDFTKSWIMVSMGCSLQQKSWMDGLTVIFFQNLVVLLLTSAIQNKAKVRIVLFPGSVTSMENINIFKC